MKFIHLSDLHLGLRLDEYPMTDSQEYILDQILSVIDAEAADAVLIAGDIYDKSVPPTEAVELFDRFLTALAARRLPVFVISGNHDSAERIAFGARLMDASGIHLSPVYDGTVTPTELTDEYGPVRVWLLPFLRPANVRRFFEGEEVESYTDAVRLAVGAMQIDPSVRNVLVTHQFVTGARRSDSERVSVGGADNVDASVFAPFDYTALGHLHSPQNCGSEKIRYCGTPLKYSFSEAEDVKSVTVAELGEKGSLTVRTVPLIPKYDMADLRGSYDELMLRSFREGKTWEDDFVRITLTDEEDVPYAVSKLRTVYHRLLRLAYDNGRTRAGEDAASAGAAVQATPLEQFADFYEKQNGRPMTEEQTAYMAALIGTIWEENA